MKKCSKCKIEKDISNFYKNKSKEDGLKAYCIPCVKENVVNFNKTKRGVVFVIYSQQKPSSLRRNHPLPKYSFNELYEWCICQDIFHELYTKWVKGGYCKYLKPSIDRLDDYKGYSFDNIQLMTWGENDKKGHKDRFNGVNNKNAKRVFQYSKDNILIKEYCSLSQASRDNKISVGSISQVLNGRREIACGYKWSNKLM